MLPLRDGVSASCVALPPGPWDTVLDFLAERFVQQGRDTWQARMAAGQVLDEDAQAVAPSCPYRPHTRLYYYRSIENEATLPFDETIIHQDEHLVVVDKPHFLPVVPSGHYLQETVLVRLRRRLGLDGLAPLHRIDRETAGLVLFTVQPHTRAAYHALFRTHRVDKRYEAIAPWRDDLVLPLERASRLGDAAHFMQQAEVPGPPNAWTRVDVLERAGPLARYALQPVSGRRHQLRVHMHALGIPIVGDSLYPVLGPAGQTDTARPLQLLARSVRFTDPLSGAQRQFESTRRLDLANVLLNARAPDRSPP